MYQRNPVRPNRNVVCHGVMDVVCRVGAHHCRQESPGTEGACSEWCGRGFIVGGARTDEDLGVIQGAEVGLERVGGGDY